MQEVVLEGREILLQDSLCVSSITLIFDESVPFPYFEVRSTSAGERGNAVLAPLAEETHLLGEGALDDLALDLLRDYSEKSG